MTLWELLFRRHYGAAAAATANYREFRVMNFIDENEL